MYIIYKLYQNLLVLGVRQYRSMIRVDNTLLYFMLCCPEYLATSAASLQNCDNSPSLVARVLKFGSATIYLVCKLTKKVQFFYHCIHHEINIRTSVPRVIAGTKICKLVTHSLVVDGHRVEARQIQECEDLSFPKKHNLAKVRCDQILMRMCITCCSDSDFSLRQFSTARLEVLRRTSQVDAEVYQLCKSYNVCPFIHLLPWNAFTLFFF